MFCPVSMTAGPKTCQRRVRHRRNNPERGVRRIYVVIASRSNGWLVYIPSVNATYPSKDVKFDEKFENTHVRLEDCVRIEGGIPLQPHPKPSQIMSI